MSEILNEWLCKPSNFHSNIHQTSTWDQPYVMNGDINLKPKFHYAIAKQTQTGNAHGEPAFLSRDCCLTCWAPLAVQCPRSLVRTAKPLKVPVQSLRGQFGSSQWRGASRHCLASWQPRGAIFGLITYQLNYLRQERFVFAVASLSVRHLDNSTRCSAVADNHATHLWNRPMQRRVWSL